MTRDSPGQLAGWPSAPFDIAAAWTTSWFDYASRALSRRVTPIDLWTDAVRFWSVATSRPSPTWSSPHGVAREWASARLLDFSTDAAADVIPTLILPPQAGYTSTIVDYTPDRSQVRTALEQGLTRIFVLEWTGATSETKNTTIEDYIAILDEAVASVGGRVNLVGDSQGGWLAAIYAALRPVSVASLSIGAAPIDFHAGRGAIREWTLAHRAGGGDPMWIYRSLVDAHDGVHSGGYQVAGFKLLDLSGELTRLAELWANITDEEYVGRYRDFVAWLETPQDLPGAFYLWAVERLFVGNELVAGTLEVGGEIVDLSRITMPVHLVAGTADHITPPEQVWALADHIGTPGADIRRHEVDVGHLDLFMSDRALNEHWAPLFGSVAQIARRHR